MIAVARLGAATGAAAAVTSSGSAVAGAGSGRLGGAGTGTGRGGAGAFGGGGPGGIQGSATTSLTTSEKQIYDYVSAHRDGASYLFAVSSWEDASPYIEATGQEVMPMGGFSGSVPEPTLAQVKELVKTGQLKFFLLSGAGGGFPGGFGGGRSGSTVSSIDSWVKQTCATVPAKDYGGTSTSSTAGATSGGTLYACSSS